MRFRVLCLMLTALFVFPTFAYANELEGITIYVAIDGNDNNNGSIDMPLKTIEKAKEKVREMNANMTADITVIIDGGLYELEDTLKFDSRDSGTNGFSVIYKAKEGENPVISGGSTVKGWTKGVNNIWSAKDIDLFDIRNLMVNNHQAVRAKTEGKVAGNGIYKENDKRIGILIDKEIVGGENHSQHMEIHWAAGWQSITGILGGVKEIPGPDNVLITSQYSAETRPDGHQPWYKAVFTLENALHLLDVPGEFYFDREEKTLYYMPYADEDMATAVVYAPRLEQLVNIRESLPERDNLEVKVENITFDSLTFAHVAWNSPSVYGYSVSQGNVNERTIIGSDPMVMPGKTFTPAAIQLNGAININFYNGVFKNLGSDGIGLYNGVSNCDIIGNVFADLSGSAITIGLPRHDKFSDGSQGTNVALNKPAKASGQYNDNHVAGRAFDGSSSTGWSAGGESSPWVSVDLEKEYHIDRVDIVTRPDNHNDSTRENFQVQGSNDPSFSKYEVLGDCQYRLPEASTWSFDVVTDKPFRYIRVAKTDTKYFYVAEVRIMSYDEEAFSVSEVVKDINFSNNAISRCSAMYWSSPVIAGYYGQNIEITHNEITDAPYSAISWGWGWDSIKTDTSRNNKINYNKIENYLLEGRDGGGIYTLGQQKDSEIKGNHLIGGVNENAAIYPDEGSRYLTIEDNVIEDTTYAFYVWYWTMYDIHLYNNWTSSPKYINRGKDSYVAGTKHFIQGNPPKEVRELIENAGLQADYENIRNRIPESRASIVGSAPYKNVIELGSGMGDLVGRYLYPRYHSALLMLELTCAETKAWEYEPEKRAKLQSITDEVGLYINGEKVTKDILFVEQMLIRLRELTNDFTYNLRPITHEYAMVVYQQINSNDKIPQQVKEELANRLNSLTEENDLRNALREAYENLLDVDIKFFSLREELYDAVIDKENAEIYLIVRKGTDLANLSPEIIISEHSKLVNPDIHDYTNPVKLIVLSNDDSVEKEWNVTIKVEGDILFGEYTTLNQALSERINWFDKESGVVAKPIEGGLKMHSAGANTIPYVYAKQGNGMIVFNFKTPYQNSWPNASITFRNKTHANFHSAINELYILSFYEKYILVGRMNGGKQTVFYGAPDSKSNLLGTIPIEGNFKFNEKNKIEIGTYTYDEGVRIIININDKNICDFVDTNINAIREPGYIGFVSPSDFFEVTGIKEEAQ